MTWIIKKNQEMIEEEFVIELRNRGEYKARLVANAKDPIFQTALHLRTRLDKKYNDSDFFSW